jgi:HAE1 family hydrophobic/amphiphilic exporter-1
MIVGLISEDGRMNGDDLRDYAQSNLEKILSRVPGVGEVESFGSQYAMRVWVDPDKLIKYRLTVNDVVASLRAYNVEASAGQLGGTPAIPGQRMNAAIVIQHLLQTPEEFASIPLRTSSDGSIVRIKDIGRTELGTERYDVQANTWASSLPHWLSGRQQVPMRWKRRTTSGTSSRRWPLSFRRE